MPKKNQLFDAISSQDLAKVKKLIELGVDVNSRNENEQTALMCASQSGDINIVKYLVEHGADIHFNNGKDTALSCALEHDNNAIANHLIGLHAGISFYNITKHRIKHGASIDIVDDRMGTVLRQASKRGDIAIVKYLIGHGSDSTAIDDCGVPLIEYAALNGNKEVVEYLLQKGVDVSNNNTLSYAIRHDWIDVVEQLLKKGANLKSFEKRNAFQRINSPIREAIISNNIEMVSLLLDNGVDVNTSCNNETLLSVAVEDSKYLDILNFLIKKGAKPNMNESNSLIVAVQNYNYDAVKVLIKNGSNVNAVVYGGLSGDTSVLTLAMSRAMYKSDCEKLEKIKNILIENGANQDGDTEADPEYLEQLRQIKEDEVQNAIDSGDAEDEHGRYLYDDWNGF